MEKRVNFRMMLCAAAATAMLAGCANKYDAITPQLQASMMADLQSGKMNLDCGEQCSFTWLAQAPNIHALDLAEKWNDLAVRVMQIGYGSDLAYYYLGQSAQGLAYHPAAIAYYSKSLSLATGMNPLTKCSAGASAGNDPCQGVDLISSIPVLIKASQDVLDQQAAAAAAASQPAPVHHHHRKPPPSGWVAPPPAAGTGGSGWSAPPPPAAQ